MEKQCLNCGQTFEAKRKDKKCCSQKCATALWIKNNPNKVKEYENKRKGINRYNSEKRKAWYKEKVKDKFFVEKQKQQAKARRDKLIQFLSNYKLEKGCQDCGYNEHPVALDFDHIKGEKSFNVSLAKSIKQAKEEIKKCEIVCSNCHRIRTYNRLNN